MILSILIPVIPIYEARFNELYNHLLNQVKGREVEILYTISKPQIEGGISTGQRRQDLLLKSKGKYIVFIDSDDWVYEYYIDEMLQACNSDADCFAINGIMTTDGQHETKWYLSKDYKNHDAREGNKMVYYRHTNHITAVKREIALDAGFPDKSNAEDKHYSDRLVLKTEYKIEKPMYWYRFSKFNKSYK